MNLNGIWKAADEENRQEGSIGDLLSVGLCILAMISVTMAFMECAGLVNQKTAISQTAREYILRMETVGYLTYADEEELVGKLAAEGVREINLSGTTRDQVGYGSEIVLKIVGKIGKDYVVEEKRVSTAKH